MGGFFGGGIESSYTATMYFSYNNPEVEPHAPYIYQSKLVPSGSILRIPDSYDAKIAKICNLWTYWAIFQLINHLSKL